jgi:hypothetical protein
MENGGYRSGWKRKHHRRTGRQLIAYVGVAILFAVAVMVAADALARWP